jgi:hypothetical protein
MADAAHGKDVVWYVRCGLCGEVYREPVKRAPRTRAMALGMIAGMAMNLARGKGSGASGYVHECEDGGLGLATVVGCRPEASPEVTIDG